MRYGFCPDEITVGIQLCDINVRVAVFLVSKARIFYFEDASTRVEIYRASEIASNNKVAIRTDRNGRTKTKSITAPSFCPNKIAVSREL